MINITYSFIIFHHAAFQIILQQCVQLFRPRVQERICDSLIVDRGYHTLTHLLIVQLIGGFLCFCAFHGKYKRLAGTCLVLYGTLYFGLDVVYRLAVLCLGASVLVFLFRKVRESGKSVIDRKGQTQLYVFAGVVFPLRIE